MIGKIDLRAYDCEGRIIKPEERESLPPAAHEFFAYLAGDLTVRCNTLGEIRAFLHKCRYVSDDDQFGIRDYWMHPVAFEKYRRGDCEDFALWTWRQLLAMGLEARFVCGRSGRDRGHAWVTFSDPQAHYLLEPTSPRRRKLWRIETLRYKPEFSISYHDNRLIYYEHENRAYAPTKSQFLALLLELSAFIAFSLMLLPWRLTKKAARFIQKLISRPEAQEKRPRDLQWVPGPLNEVDLQKIRVTVNELLPGCEDLVSRLREAGVPSSKSGLASRPLKKRLITFGPGISLEGIREMVNLSADFVDFIQITEDIFYAGHVYIGSYRHRAAGPMAKLTPELKAILSSADLSMATLRAAIVHSASEESLSMSSSQPVHANVTHKRL